MNFANMTAAHFVLIPAVLIIGMVIGWILGSRAAADAYQAELKRREERAGRTMHAPTADHQGHEGTKNTK
jgi:hypothetical protein